MTARTVLRWVWMSLISCAFMAGIAGIAGCDALKGPPAAEWPGPHAPYPFPDDVPHRTE
ncbi:hypothetical protein [Paraburkholderia ginsengiterrae]|uniref:hypothetical protein n=1 Tax=Paraburkholderia ginsengiterrae TaxID=1462993 RepID=UPI000AA4FEF4|nr:hypothetical protein [Paraburkholderia ginsengiterrae]